MLESIGAFYLPKQGRQNSIVRLVCALKKNRGFMFLVNSIPSIHLLKPFSYKTVSVPSGSGTPSPENKGFC